MTPERIREALVDVNARIAQLDTERELLVTLVHGWESLLRFLQGDPIEQPQQGTEGQGMARGVVKAPLPAAVSNAGAVRVKRTSAHQAGDAGSTPAPRSTPAGPTSCPECGKPVKPQGLGVHRRMAHRVGVGPQPRGGRAVAELRAKTTPTIEQATSTARHRIESFVCGRCTASFLSRDGRDGHQATHRPIPPYAPVRSIGRGGVGE